MRFWFDSVLQRWKKQEREGEKQHIIVPDIVFFKSKAINYKLEVRKARTRQVYAHKINQNTAFVVALENKSKQEQKG